ncbi:hypothetical protein T12_7491 [Trichinella patagoniensis]|uniref:Uncharacterized protein n=1 Tax=Trichinella patagoniensis TaxID=990121 RepID=A0A0V0ZIY7_9BILA|nr:hypothetical protein T12_7491 [Trichinella patagoniensis]
MQIFMRGLAIDNRENFVYSRRAHLRGFSFTAVRFNSTFLLSLNNGTKKKRNHGMHDAEQEKRRGECDNFS